MKARVKKLEETISNKVKQPDKFFRIIKDRDSYSIPTELIILLGDNPEDYPKEGENRVARSSSGIVDKVLNIEPEKNIKLIILNIVDNGDTRN